MLVGTLRTVYDYHAWATERVLNMASLLTSEQLLAPAPAGQRSVRDTLVHVIRAQQSWLSWWDGSLSAEQARAFKLDPAGFPDIPTVRVAWEEAKQKTEAFLSGLSDDDAVRVYVSTLPDGSEWRLPLWQMVLHVANHGTQHRSEVASLLTGFGHSPGDLDMIFYLVTREASAGRG